MQNLAPNNNAGFKMLRTEKILKKPAIVLIRKATSSPIAFVIYAKGIPLEPYTDFKMNMVIILYFHCFYNDSFRRISCTGN